MFGGTCNHVRNSASCLSVFVSEIGVGTRNDGAVVEREGELKEQRVHVAPQARDDLS
jgi:hypothetical protein